MNKFYNFIFIKNVIRLIFNFSNFFGEIINSWSVIFKNIEKKFKQGL